VDISFTTHSEKRLRKAGETFAASLNAGMRQEPGELGGLLTTACPLAVPAPGCVVRASWVPPTHVLAQDMQQQQPQQHQDP
jgi:hypothetical protein